jgi:acetyltransferase
LITENPEIKELDINPLIVSPEAIVALDARVILHPKEIADDRLPRPAIRPYPNEYASTAVLKNNEQVYVRPIRPEDENLMVDFHQQLSDRTVQMRFMHAISLATRIAHERLRSICFTDYNRDIVLVAIRKGTDKKEEILGVGRLSKLRHENGGEVAILIRDDQQGHGLGSALLQRLIQIARAEKLGFLRAIMLASNEAMKQLARSHGFRFTPGYKELVAVYQVQESTGS